MLQVYTYHTPFQLESGTTIPGFHLAYTILGKLNAERNNVVWVFHALTANSNALEWWHGLIGEGKLFDPSKHCIICVNMPGSCYGSISPMDKDHSTGKPYFHHFPWFTTRDMIRAYQHLKTHLQIDKVWVGLGGSMGGQQLLEWAIEEPNFFEHIIPIATNAQHSPWGIAFNATQRQAIENDVTWQNRNADAGLQGMKTARAIALISYRHYDTYFSSQHGSTEASENENIQAQIFKAETYQKYQGEKLARRFNAFSYYFLSKGMDAHNVGRGRVSVNGALKKITAKTLAIGIQSDILFPLVEQELLANEIPGAQLQVIYSLYGHDGFLLEFEKITGLLKSFLMQ